MKDDGSIQSLFKDTKYCREEIVRIRQAIGQRTCSDNNWQAAFDALAMMLTHCPDELVDLVNGQIGEANIRYQYFLVGKVLQS